jgi:cell fate (sporulation/competence/biofilm development) regulator YlbF (YheA/YmcA/DUF963 family)
LVWLDKVEGVFRVDRILSLAKRLGQAVREDERHEELQAAREAVNAQEKSRDLFEGYYKQQEKVSELMAQQKPVEPEDKKKLAQLQQDLAADDNAKRLLKAEADFAHLMRQVNQSIQSAMSGADESG